MNATPSFSLRFARVSDSKVETTDWVPSRQVLQRIATRMSLVSEAIGFWVLGIPIIVNRNQADLNGLAGGSSVAIVGGISAVFVATIFLVAACVHWRFCAKHPATLVVRRRSDRFTFAWPEPAVVFAVQS